MTRLLLYVCCAPDATVAIERLRPDFDITMFFHNPNVHPREEYNRRREAARQLGEILQVKVLEGDYDTSAWFEAVKGLEQEPERGRRCEVCLRERLEATARVAAEQGYGAFAAVLTVSPHKDAAMINRMGARAGDQYGVAYIPTDLKKKDGFKRSVALSREYGLYRQNYCGCGFSRKKGEESSKGKD